MPQLFLQNIAGVQIFLLHKKLYLISLHWQQASIPTGLMLCGPWSGPSLLSKALYEPISVSILGLFLVQTNAQVFSLNISQDHSKNHFKKKKVVPRHMHFIQWYCLIGRTTMHFKVATAYSSKANNIYMGHTT